MRITPATKTFTRIVLVAISIAFASCSRVNPADPTVAFLEKVQLTDFAITGTTTLLGLNQTSQLIAKAKTPEGLATVTNKATWTSADASIAVVSSDGVIKAVGFGSTSVTARLNDQEATQRVDVIAPTGMTLNGTTTFTTLNRTNQLTLVATWPGGLSRSVNTDAIWSCDNPSVATVSSSGALRSIGFGSATLTVKYQTLTISVKVDVVLTFSQLTVQGSLAFGGPGQSSALIVLAVFSDNSTKDVTSETTWTTSDPAVALISPSSVLTAIGFGTALITANYQGHTRAFTVTVTPPGTFVASGRVRDPGNGQGEGLGVPGFLIRDTRSGLTTMSTETGYGLAGVLVGDRLTYEKDGWETAEITFAKTTDNATPAVQQVVRVNVGATASIETAPNDLRYDLDTGVFCSPCRRVRVVSPGAGTVHLQLSWTGTSSRLSIWAGGKAYTAAGPTVVTADVPLNSGENIVYVGLLNGGPFSTDYLTLKLTTSVVTAEAAARGGSKR